MVEVEIMVSLTGGMATGMQLTANPQEEGLEYFDEEPCIPRVAIEYI